MSSPHPRPAQLDAFAQGKLDEATAATISRHLWECPDCWKHFAGHSAGQSTRAGGGEARPTAVAVSGRTVSRASGPAGVLTGSYPEDASALGYESTVPGAGRAPAAALPGELADHPRYVVLELIGSGGMGTVYQARHRFMDRVVALKVIRQQLLDQPEMVARFRREVMTAARLAHPNIVTAYDAEECGSTQFLVMEYVPGTNLAELIVRDGPLPVARACDYVLQAALGLQHAFVQGTIHRDIKPHNLIRTSCPSPLHGEPTDVVKILDFGLARFVTETHPVILAGESGAPTPEHAAPADPHATATEPGSVVGTHDYMAPEHILDPRGADIRADIYSLGCTFYHLLAGRPPFADVPRQEKLTAHVERAPRPIRDLRPDVPAELEQVLGRMMAKDPAERYPTPAEAAAALVPFVTDTSALGQAAPPETVPPAPTPAGRRYGRPLAAALLLIAALGLAWYASTALLRPGTRPEATGLGGVELRRFEGHTGPVRGVAFSPDGRSLLSASFDGTVRLWDVATGRQLRALEGHSGRVYGVAYLLDGRHAFSGGADRTLRLWDLDTGKELRRFTGHTEPVTSVAVSPDGTRVLSGGEDFTARLWDVATGQELHAFPGGGKSVEAVAFSPDGRTALSAGWDKVVHVWDVDSNREVGRFEGHTEGVKAVAFAPDGRRVVSGGEDRMVRVWDVATGQELVSGRHTHWVWGVAFSHDGRRVLSASWDRTARLWDADTGRELRRFEPDTDEILSVAFAPDDRDAVSAGSDKMIRLWELPRRAAHFAGRSAASSAAVMARSAPGATQHQSRRFVSPSSNALSVGM